MEYSIIPSASQRVIKSTSQADLNSLTKISQIKNNHDGRKINEGKSNLNFWQVARLYTIGRIPIIDFIIVYIILYIINSIKLHYNYKFILIAVIPIVILINIFINKNLKPSFILILIVAISLYFLVTTNPNDK
jgi:hypothetical protein